MSSTKWSINPVTGEKVNYHRRCLWWGCSLFVVYSRFLACRPVPRKDTDKIVTNGVYLAVVVAIIVSSLTVRDAISFAQQGRELAELKAVVRVMHTLDEMGKISVMAHMDLREFKLLVNSKI